MWKAASQIRLVVPRARLEPEADCASPASPEALEAAESETLQGRRHGKHGGALPPEVHNQANGSGQEGATLQK